MLPVIEFLPPLLLATLVAIGGATLGLILQHANRRRMELLVHLATGALLGITAFDILPEAKAVLSWPIFVMAVCGGYALLWSIGRFVYHVCPSCAISEMDDASLARKRDLHLLAAALGVHCLMDGLAITTGGMLSAQAGWAALFGVGLHKLPEGLALGLLLAGARYKSGAAILFASGVESMTLVGGLLATFIPIHPSPSLIGGIFAIVGGSFIYLVVNALRGALTHHSELPKRQTLTIEACSFLATAGIIYAASRI